MRRPTILFMNRVYPPVRGASGRVLKDLAKSFAREGWHVTVVSSGPVPGEERKDGVRIIRVKGAERPSGVFAYMFVWIKMWWVAMRLKSRHLLVTMTDPPLIVYAGHWIAKYKGSRHIHWSQDLYPEVFPALGVEFPKFMMRFMRNLRKKAMRRCDKVIVSGRCMAKHLVMEGLDAQKIAMVPNWPDIELTDPDTADDTLVKPPIDEKVSRPFEKLLKTEQRFRVLYAGNLGRAHDVETILGAAQILQEREADVEFVFVGDGARIDYIAEQRGERRLDNIKLMPYQPVSQLREVMESGDIHLISMHEDAAGYIVPCKLYASFAACRPAILVGPEQSETAKVIRDFGTGFVVPPGDAEQLVSSIMCFRENSDAWNDAYQGALQAREVFTPHDSIEAWMERAWDAVKDDLGA